MMIVTERETPLAQWTRTHDDASSKALSMNSQELAAGNEISTSSLSAIPH